MTRRSAIPHNRSILHKWFGPNRGTHWSIAGSVGVIILGSYLVYSSQKAATTIIVVEQSPAATTPASPAPPTPEK
jgi:hypothetical protein